ncbi:hypothetical protein HOD41_07620 [bacterium]|jgi:hypothetical protein|nr:hypothetical protein [bacterium]MBT7311744.1 hypothetical protein [bacterium]
MELLIPILAVGMSLMIPIVAIITDYFRKKDKMRVIEKALEHGASLEGLDLNETKAPHMPYRAGMVCSAAGLGVAALGWFIGDPEATGPMAGIGAIVLLIGLALLINDYINRDRFNR